MGTSVGSKLQQSTNSVHIHWNILCLPPTCGISYEGVVWSVRIKSLKQFVPKLNYSTFQYFSSANELPLLRLWMQFFHIMTWFCDIPSLILNNGLSDWSHLTNKCQGFMVRYIKWSYPNRNGIFYSNSIVSTNVSHESVYPHNSW